MLRGRGGAAHHEMALGLESLTSNIEPGGSGTESLVATRAFQRSEKDAYTSHSVHGTLLACLHGSR